MRVFLFQLLFQFASTSVIEGLLPIINITVSRDDKNHFHARISPNCCVINFPDYFKVMVYMENTNQVKKMINCFAADNLSNKMINQKLLSDSGGYSAQLKANAYMATEWKCQLNSSSTSSFFTPAFKVHVRGQRRTTLYINKNFIVKHQANYTTTDYDEYVFHSYIDGEMTKFKYAIYNVASSSNHQNLYRNNVTDEEFVVDNEGILWLRLTKEYNNNYLDCEVSERNADGTISTTLRVFFQMKTALEFPRFMINELVLNPVSQSNDAEYQSNNPNGTFVYYYLNYENVTIRTLTENGSSLNCSNDKKSLQTVKDINLNTTLRKENNNFKISCTVKDSQQQNSVLMTLKLRINLSYDFYPMYGLSWSNVLAKYKNSTGAAVIKYSYRGDRLVLVCHALVITRLRWKFNLNETSCQDINGPQQNYSEAKWFVMKSNYNRTTIQCFEDSKPGTQVELIRDGSLQYTPKTDIMKYFDSTENNNDINSLAPTTNTDTESGNKADDGVSVSSTSSPNDNILIPTEFSEKNIDDNDKESFLKMNSRPLLICGTVTIATIVIAIIVCVIIKRFKHKRVEQANSSNINYENLPEHKDGPMPIPQQWQCEDDEVTYSTPDVGKSIDNLYTKPIPKSLRNTTPIYAEAYDHTNKSGADYVNTGRFVKKTANEGNDDSNYSEVYQSNEEANSNSKIKYANIDQINDTYAQAEPKTTQDSANIGSLKEHNYGNLNVNQSFNHYSEPAYAEIQ